MMIDFWAVWCGPCYRLKEEVYPSPDVQAFADDFIFIRINHDERLDLIRAFRVQGLPTLLFLDPFGNALGRHRGLLQSSLLTRILSRIPKDYEKLAEHAEGLHSDPKEPEALMAAGAFYLEQGHVVLGKGFFRAAKEQAAVEGRTSVEERALLSVALVELHSGQPAQAEAVLSEEIDRFRGSEAEPRLLNALAMTHTAQRQFDEARRLYEEVRSRFEGTQDAQLAEERLEALPDRAP